MSTVYRIEIDIRVDNSTRTKVVHTAREDYRKSPFAWTLEDGRLTPPWSSKTGQSQLQCGLAPAERVWAVIFQNCVCQPKKRRFRRRLIAFSFNPKWALRRNSMKSKRGA